jgi:flagellar motor switch protein FliM
MAEAEDTIVTEDTMTAPPLDAAIAGISKEPAAPIDDIIDPAELENDTQRILNQDEIDSLLGFEDGGSTRANTGIMILANNALVNYERLPMLDVVFDRMGRLLSTSLRNLTSDNVEASIDAIESVRFGDYLNSVPLPAMLSIIKAEEWDNQGLIVCDSSLIYSMVDVLLGGRKGASALRIEGRPYTTIECNLMERVLHVALNDMSSAFDPLSPVTFRFERLETNPRFAAITQSNNAAVLIKIRIDMEGRGGMMEILLPYATLEPIREILLQMFMGEKFGRDSIWEGHLTKELYKTDVEIHAILGERTVSLRDVMEWKVGSTILLETKQDDLVELRCGQRPMFTGKIGRKDKNIAIRLEEEIVTEQEAL